MNASVFNERGERLSAVLASDPLFPPTFVLVIATLGNDVLLVRNRTRAVWELPGGFVDVNETPEDCAHRELREESGQDACDMTCMADILIDELDGSSFRGRVFRTALRGWKPFVPNTEIDACRIWSRGALPTTLSAIDAYLVQRLL